MRKYIIIIFVAIAILTFNASHSFSAEESAKIKNEDAQNALKELIPDVKILEIRQSQVNNLLEIAIETQGQKGIVYLDSDLKHAVFGPIIDLKTKANLTQERNSELNKVDVSQIPLDDALVMGEKDAKYRVIIFDDPD